MVNLGNLRKLLGRYMPSSSIDVSRVVIGIVLGQVVDRRDTLSVDRRLVSPTIAYPVPIIF